MAFFVRDAQGTPVPPSDLLARLHRRCGADLGLKYVAGAWAVTAEWPANDPRWQMVQEQQYPREGAHDIVGYIPVECPLEEAGAYIERSFRSHSREDVRRRLADALAWNERAVPEQQVAETVAAVLDAETQGRKKPRSKRVLVSAE